jgi:hypothetical protein
MESESGKLGRRRNRKRREQDQEWRVYDLGYQLEGGE